MGDSFGLTTGEMAYHLGMTSQGLHWYEAKGLIEPERENSYRRFSLSDFCLLSRIRFYHQVGFGIEETESMLSMGLDGIADAMQGLVDKKRAEYEKELARLAVVEDRIRLTRDFETMRGTYRVIETEPFYFKKTVRSDSSEFTLADGSIKSWTEDIPFVQYVSCNDLAQTPASLSQVGMMLPEKCLPYVGASAASAAPGADPFGSDGDFYGKQKAVYGVFGARANEDDPDIARLVGHVEEGALAGVYWSCPITCRRVDGVVYAYWERWFPLSDEGASHYPVGTLIRP